MVRKSRVDQIPHDELLAMVKKELDALTISYKEEPGGLGDIAEAFLHPPILED